MTDHHCWTCGTDHPPGAPCARPSPARAADDLFDGAAPVATRALKGHPFPANYEGECTAGGDSIFPGEMIIKTDDGWSHQECAE